MNSQQTMRRIGEMKKIGLVAIVFCLIGTGLAVLFINNAEAAGYGYYTCTISMVGATNSFYFVKLTDTADPQAFTDQFFFVDPAGAHVNVIIATLLTAWANSGKVWVGLDDTAPGSPLFLAGTVN
jgi:hypothetical protein